MHWFDTVNELSAWRARSTGDTLGLVPTMGNLHAGHRALLEAAVARCDRVVASIFVNPLQFGPGEDLDSYPRTLDADRQMLADVGVDAVFAPSVTEVYPQGGASATRVYVEGLSSILCGEQRPQFFGGVATVVNKLFNMVRPEVSFFGEKDYQQLLVIRRMVADLCMDIEVVGIATVRETDGLALSSRNQYLDPQQRRVAPELAVALRACIEQLEQGRREFALLEREGVERLRAAGFEPDYFAVRDVALDLPAVQTREFRVLAAATLGRARLIDNMGVAVAD